MIKLFISPSCSSCRKVRDWFKIHKIPFEEKNILDGSMTENDLKEMLTKSLDGTSDIISTRSKIIKENNIDLEELTISQLYDFILKNPTILKRPIIVDDRKLQTGYDKEEIRAFLPEIYRMAQKNCSKESCEQFDNCVHRLDEQ